jgi:peroxiredoxin Q/BCP
MNIKGTTDFNPRKFPREMVFFNTISYQFEIFGNFMEETVNLEVGDNSPKFVAQDSDGVEHDIQGYMKQGKHVILYFYPKDSTPGCTKQACDFRDNIARLQSNNTVVFGVSKDSAKSHKNFISKQELNFPLLMDEDLSLHQMFGTWRLKKNYGREYLGTARSTFVISPEGTITWARYNVKATGHVDMLLRELKY